jgi:uncharacterized protein YaaR (DUF327 family)
LGHFYAAIGNDVRKVYVLPVGVPESVGVEVARGIRTPESVRDNFLKRKVMEVDDLVWKEKYEEEKRNREELEKEFGRQVERLGDLKAGERVEAERQKAFHEALQKVDEIKKQWNIEEYQKTIAQLKDEKATLETTLKQLEPLKAFKEALIKFLGIAGPPGFEPASSVSSEIAVAVEQPALILKKETAPLALSQGNVDGRVAIAYAEDLLGDKWFTKKKLNDIIEQRFGKKEPYPNLQKPLINMTAWGFFEFHKAGPRSEWRVKLSPKNAQEKGLLKEEKPKP